MPAPVWPVTAPPNRAPSRGLVALAVPHPEQETVGERWVNGIVFDPETCEPGQTVAVQCVPQVELSAASGGPLVAVAPVALFGSDRCSTMDVGREPEAVARARRHLAATQSAQLETVLWTGAAEGDPEDPDEPPRQALTDGADVVTETPLSAADAVTALDQALTECLHGASGMLHMAPGLLTQAAAADVVDLVGGHWETPNGHVIVAGAGYPPDGGWVFGTGPVHVLLSAEQEPTVDIDRSTNTRTVRASRFATAFFSPCCHVGVQVQLPEGVPF